MPTTKPAPRAVETLERRQMLAAEAYDWKPATIKANGFIDGIVFSPTTAGLSYIHTDMGGAYRYDASRSKWTNITDFAKYTDSAGKSMGVETLAIDPTDANRVYLGLGTYMQNSAVLRSTDRGQTWSRTDVPFQMNGNGSGRNTGERMMVDPNSPNVLYYGSRDDGLWKSVNYGANWSQVTTFPTIGLDSGWGADTGILFVLFDKTSSTAGTPSQNIYVGVFDPTAGVNRIYRSTNAGTSWAAMPGGQPTAANLFPQRAALTPDGSTLYITYATSTSYPGPYGVGNGNVYKVVNPSAATPTWTDVQPLPDTNYAYSGIALDPTNPNTVYITELGDYNPADRIWRSTNGGTSWTVMNPNSHRDDSSAPYAATSKVHWMGDLQIDPLDRNVAMFSTGYGLYRTTNLTATEPNWTFFNDGFEQSAVLEFASPPTGPVNLFSAIGDRDGYRHVDFDVSPAGGVLGSSNGMNKGTSPDIDVAWNDSNYLVRVTQTSPYVQVSSNNGVTWSWLSSTGITGGNDGHTAISADGTRVIYEPGGTGNQLLYATRTGSNWSGWTAPASGRPADGSDILVDLVDGSTFYAQSGTTISRSTDGGVNWTVMTTTAPSGISWVRAVPNNAGHLVASAGGNGVWRSTNGGASWTRLSTSVTDAYAVGVGATKPGGTYPSIYVAGTMSGATGFHCSDDAGVTWTTISDADHQFGYAIVIQGDPRVYGRLYVGTNGRGIQVGEPLKATGLLPAGWQDNDIGSPALAGGGGAVSGKYTLVGTGTGLINAADQFHLTSTAAGGDTTFSARVESISGPTGNARAGVILRASLAADAPFAMVEQLDDGTVRFIWRATAGSIVQTTAPVGEYASAKYLRLVRTGDSFVGSYSLNGTTWTDVAAPQTIIMTGQIRAGLAANGRDASTLAKAVFTNVQLVTDTVAPTVASISFDYAAFPVAVRATFSENVIGSLSVDDLTITLAAGGPTITPAAFVYDPATLGVRFDLPGDLAAGDYTAVLGSFADTAGNASTTTATLNFFHQPADINRDRAVNFDDLLVVAQHYDQTTGATFADGDLTGDGAVNFDDLLLLAQNYGATLLSAQPAMTQATGTTKARRKSVVSGLNV